MHKDDTGLKSNEALKNTDCYIITVLRCYTMHNSTFALPYPGPRLGVITC